MVRTVLETAADGNPAWFAFDDGFVLMDETGCARLFDSEAEARAAPYLPSPYFSRPEDSGSHRVGQTVRVKHPTLGTSGEARILAFLPERGTILLDRPVLGFRAWNPDYVAGS